MRSPQNAPQPKEAKQSEVSFVYDWKHPKPIPRVKQKNNSNFVT